MRCGSVSDLEAFGGGGRTGREQWIASWLIVPKPGQTVEYHFLLNS